MNARNDEALIEALTNDLQPCRPNTGIYRAAIVWIGAATLFVLTAWWNQNYLPRLGSDPIRTVLLVGSVLMGLTFLGLAVREALPDHSGPDRRWPLPQTLASLLCFAVFFLDIATAERPPLQPELLAQRVATLLSMATIFGSLGIAIAARLSGMRQDQVAAHLMAGVATLSHAASQSAVPLSPAEGLVITACVLLLIWVGPRPTRHWLASLHRHDLTNRSHIVR